MGPTSLESRDELDRITGPFTNAIKTLRHLDRNSDRADRSLPELRFSFIHFTMPVIKSPPAGEFQISTRLGLALALVTAAGCAATRSPADAPERCPPSVTATISPEKPTVRVSYTEPTVNMDQHPLKALSKTTIYYDMGQGRQAAKQVPATAPTGGGEISETITVPLPESRPIAVRICVTATDRSGLESQTTP